MPTPKRKKREVKAWAIIGPRGGLMTPAEWGWMNSTFENESFAKATAAVWKAGSKREYKVVPCTITY